MINLIVAISKNNIIGKKNNIPWYYPEDLKYFKKITTGKTVVMGRKTFQSIIDRNGKILPNRQNIVITRDQNFKHENVIVINDVNEYIKNFKNEEIFVMGGSEIYNLFMPHTDKLYITHVNKEYDGDVYFPEIDYSQFELISKDDQNELSFCVYQRKN
jgi:dihydrofolate reductase